jgi:hypothetical protein
MTKTAAILACAATLLLISGEAGAAQQGTAQPQTQDSKPESGASPGAIEGEGAKSETGEPAKPENGTAPTGPEGAETPQPEADSGPESLGELTRNGFEIHTTEFVPAEAVTRQSGKVSSDAIVVTLQKSGATAVCFYTLKAYVGKKLATIPACTVHR